MRDSQSVFAVESYFSSTTATAFMVEEKTGDVLDEERIEKHKMMRKREREAK